jgi:hypothetical protein
MVRVRLLPALVKKTPASRTFDRSRAMYDPSARHSGKEDDVRTMMRVTIPVAAGNAAIKTNRLPQVMADAMARMQPEAAYFTADNGFRTAYFFVDLKDQSQIPVFAEPFFQELEASVEFLPVMNADDLKKGLSQVKP